MALMDAVLDGVCSQKNILPLFMGVCLVMAAFLAFSFVTLGSEALAQPILVIDTALIVVAFGVFSTTYWLCTRRAMNE